MHLYFSTGNSQPREPALYRMYRDTFVQYTATAHVSLVVGEVVVVVVAAADTDVRLAKHLSSQVPQVARDLHRYDTIRCDERCYFNVRSKADISIDGGAYWAGRARPPFGSCGPPVSLARPLF